MSFLAFTGDPSNNQEVFNHVWNHYVVKKCKRSTRTNSGITVCSYCTPQGARCAIGCLFTRKTAGHLEGLFKGKTPEGEAKKSKALRGFLEGIGFDVSFLLELQDAHDSVMFDDRAELILNLRQVAKRNNLTIPGED